MVQSFSFFICAQEANVLQQKLESEVSIFVSMVKNEEMCGRTPVFLERSSSATLSVCVCM